MHREALENVLNVERMLDVDSLRYGDFNYWPIVRSELFHNFIRKVRVEDPSAHGPALSRITKDEQARDDQTLTFIGPTEAGLVHFDPSEVQKVYQLGGARPDVMVFCRHEEIDQTISGKSFARYLDSIFEVASEDLSVLKVVDIDTSAFSADRYVPCLFVHARHLLDIPSHIQPRTIQHFDHVQDCVQTAGLGDFLNQEEGLIFSLFQIEKWAKGFQHMLEHVKPRLVICSTYWHPLNYPLMLAAHRANIPTVDVQHGRLGPDHGNYTQLTKIPTTGFELLPDTIWCWGETTRGDILRDRPADRPFHLPVVGGNPWLERWPRTKSELGLETSSSIVRQMASGRKVILLSLQPLETPLTDVMLDSMHRSPPEWVWLVRPHPRQKHALADIAQTLDARGVAYLDLEISRNLPLYAVLENVDHQVTYYSSTAFDGLDFGIKTTLIDGPGREIYRSFIEQGVFEVASTADQVISSIERHLSEVEPSTARSFIAKGLELSKQTLNTLLLSASS